MKVAKAKAKLFPIMRLSAVLAPVTHDWQSHLQHRQDARCVADECAWWQQTDGAEGYCGIVSVTNPVATVL